jgi:hypothetical protein
LLFDLKIVLNELSPKKYLCSMLIPTPSPLSSPNPTYPPFFPSSIRYLNNAHLLECVIKLLTTTIPSNGLGLVLALPASHLRLFLNYRKQTGL